MKTLRTSSGGVKRGPRGGVYHQTSSGKWASGPPVKEKRAAGSADSVGKVVGKTGSGKPIYAPSSAHNAAYEQLAHGLKEQKMVRKLPGTFSLHVNDLEKMAYAASDAHAEHARSKLGYSRQDHRDAAKFWSERGEQEIADSHRGYSRKPV